MFKKNSTKAKQKKVRVTNCDSQFTRVLKSMKSSLSPKIKDLISDDSFNQFQYRTTIEYDFNKLEWSYYEFGFFKRTIKPDQWINYDHSMMHDPVYPKLNDRLIFFKNWITDQYAMDVFSSNWPYRVIVNKGLGSVFARHRPNSLSVRAQGTFPDQPR